ncbi:hypothetical protein FACS189429_6230 [Bacteroidia bacterium]|nr:hypothetical protein FACS189429_6230 [Bacteroidia bacterium]GHV44865.1 hypothetical protein FACS1894180_6730 [Bacteroidia bacterium]
MKLQILYDLQQEVNRLFVAGSKFASGDPRLQKYVPLLKKMGEKVPVFTKLAEQTEDLLQSDTQNAAEKLANLSILLYSVLYTQGEQIDSQADELPQIPSVELAGVKTEYTYRVLKPIIDALTTAKPGRMELLHNAYERKVFTDSRTFPYLNFALADKSVDVANYVETPVIQSVGKSILPFILNSFKIDDKAEQVRRLRILHRLKYEGMNDLINEILAKSAPSLEATAIEILSENPASEALIFTMTDSRNKIVREAAYFALAKFGTPESLQKLQQISDSQKDKANHQTLEKILKSVKKPFNLKNIFRL